MCYSFTILFNIQVGQGYPHDAPKVKCETQVCSKLCLTTMLGIHFTAVHWCTCACCVYGGGGGGGDSILTPPPPPATGY